MEVTPPGISRGTCREPPGDLPLGPRALGPGGHCVGTQVGLGGVRLGLPIILQALPSRRDTLDPNHRGCSALGTRGATFLEEDPS